MWCVSNRTPLALTVLLLIAAIAAFGQTPCEILTERLATGELQAVNELVKEAKDCPATVGQVYLRKGDNEKAEQYFKQGYDLTIAGSPAQAASLSDLGIVYWNTGNAGKAEEYLQRALAIRQQSFGNDHDLVAASYNDLGLIISSSDPDKALDYYEKALNTYKNVFGENHEKTIQALINTGIAYRNLELYGDATVNFERALELWKALHPDGHPNEAFIINNMGRTKQVMNDVDGALNLYQQALMIYIKFYGKNHPEVARTHNLIGNVYNARGEFDMALSYYQQALMANTTGFDNSDIESNPPVATYLDANTLLNSLYYKSKAFADLHYNKTLKFNDLKLSLATLQSCDSLIDQIRKTRTNESDKIALGTVAATVYETGVELCKGMGDVAVKKDDFYKLSFYFAEKSKSAVLLEAIADANAKEFAGLSGTDLQKEKELKNDITFYETLLAATNDATARDQYRKELIELHTTYQQFISYLEQQYPDYFNLKYMDALPDVGAVQGMLQPDQTVLSYFLTEATNRVYIFEISADKFKLHNVPQTELFDNYLSGFRNGIYFRVRDVYLSTASELHDILLPKKLLNKDTKRLIIIPFGRLSTLPFEALLTEKIKSDLSFAEMPYLNNDLAISYAYSSALLKPISGSTGTTALLCAPVTFDELPSLPGTEQEVSELTGILKGKGYNTTVRLQREANENELKQLAGQQFNYVHLATHGMVNEMNPALSRVYLKAGGAEDGNLYTGEIYNLTLKSNLVTLSACETGLGKLSKGEGVIGLTRALLFAGASNLVVSLWQVADDSTSDLMTSFYSQTSDNSFAVPLQMAKASLINTTEFAEPYFWAPFILVGQ